MKPEEILRQQRGFLKNDIRDQTDFSQVPRLLGVPAPPLEQPAEAGQRVVPLPEWRGAVIPKGTADALVSARRSLRRIPEEPLTAEELSYLLFMTAGVVRTAGENVFRAVPSGGNRHSLETYLALTLKAVDAKGEVALEAGLWRYLPLEHALVSLGCPENLKDRVDEATNRQTFVARAPAVFFWATRPARAEWRYGQAAHKAIAFEAGHVCQNLYLACGAVGLGTCAIADYSQRKTDDLLGLDGEEEFVTYLAPVGRNPYQ